MPTVEISERAFEFLQKHAEPLVDTTATVLDKILFSNVFMGDSQSHTSSGTHLTFSGKNRPSVKFTTIRSATIAGKPATKATWNHILEDMISACISAGYGPAVVRETLKANTVDGERSDIGYRYVPAAQFSFQGLEANRVYDNIVALAERFKVPFNAELQWGTEPNAAYPGETALLSHP